MMMRGSAASLNVAGFAVSMSPYPNCPWECPGRHPEYCWYSCVSKKNSKKGIFSDLRHR